MPIYRIRSGAKPCLNIFSFATNGLLGEETPKYESHLQRFHRAPMNLITGATGLIGQRLASRLTDVRVAARAIPRARKIFSHPDIQIAEWDPMESECPESALNGVGTVFHLAGEPIANGRWTSDRKNRIEQSRVLGTRHLVQSMAKMGAPPSVMVSASAVGYYGDAGDALLDEASQPGNDFLSGVCARWEEEALKAVSLGVRVVCLRIGVVLSRKGGALEKMELPFRLGAGGRIGSGQQWMSWIHENDLVNLMVHAAINPECKGPMNAVAPSPVTNANFTKSLGRALGRPTLVPVPKRALRLALGDMADILLYSQNVRARRAQETGFEFAFPTIDAALGELYGG
jgi:uncharacterized protein